MGGRLSTAASSLQEPLTSIRTEWLNIGLSTEPADRMRAEQAVVKAYATVHLPPPPIVVWVQSPFAGNLAIQLIHAQQKDRPVAWRFQWLRRRLTSRARCNLPRRAWSEIQTDLQPVEDRVWKGVAQLADGAIRSMYAPSTTWLEDVWGLVRSQTGDFLHDEDPIAVWERLRAPGGLHDPRPIRPWYGNHEAGRLARLEAAERIAGPDQRLVGLAELARSGGWCWPTRNAVVLCDRPTRLECDDDGKLHCESGPALVYRDGWSVYAWHGVGVSDWVIEQPDLVRLPMISEHSGFEQQVLLERYGCERFIRDLGSEVHSDDWGKLWRASLLLDEPLVMVQVLNASPEPDGRFKDYFLRVPPSVRSAREAVAWTFGASARSYEPEVQT